MKIIDIKLFTLAVIVLIISFALPLIAESILLKDGTVIEGDITKETDMAMYVKLLDAKKITIQRKDVLRTLVNNTYKTKMYITKNDKTVLPVYIVGEDNEKYGCRKELQSADEFVVNKDDVMFISKVAPVSIIDQKAEEIAKGKTEITRKQNIMWRAPLVRLGFSPMYNVDDELEYLYIRRREYFLTFSLGDLEMIREME
ncbi:MAG: hypothetical protein N2316_01510 [Spirochaetes bacterium]|nr:hypothetical protein [Spirochaetota bacterium]